ncbi:50S ribosomal protein L29 [bacterium HR17]|jgi:large subunit ribosomal protein L29|uniref:Large ribosomal subunit protein uL29 n=1 Tax=Candidatus Fervidibacter japonicus TaxID=2035412 RepID=A0A2H5XDK7_9BACT|nr:50S ribosomal protein L29 [bacterium HR17]
MSKRQAFLERLRQMGDAELVQELENIYRELFNLRQQKAIGKGVVERSHRIRELRKNVARIKTLLRERELLRIGA